MNKYQCAITEHMFHENKFYLATPNTTMPIPAALEDELLVFCSRELGRAAVGLLCRYCSGMSVLTENLKQTHILFLYSLELPYDSRNRVNGFRVPSGKKVFVD